MLIFKNENDIRVLSRITIKENTILKNESFRKIDFDKQDELNYMINSLKNTYEDYWKNTNQINTSIKLPLIIKIDSKNNSKISDLEQILNKIDLIYDFSISKFDKEFVYYQIIFNGTPSIFLKTMKNFNFNFDTQNKIWQVK